MSKVGVKTEQEQQQQSISSRKLTKIKQQITLTTGQLRQLVSNEEKLLTTVNKLNHEGSNLITNELFNEAVIYLNEAERILQYAASYGKKIDRNLIIMTLHNEACAYQRLWYMDKTLSYLDGIIFNFTSYFEHQPKFIITKDIIDTKSRLHQSVSVYIDRKTKLAIYYLQYSAVNSQSRKHQIALECAGNALKILKETCATCLKIQMVSESENTEMYSELQIVNDEQSLKLQYYERYLRNAKSKMLKFHQNLLKHSNHSFIQDQLQKFSISSLMQMQPLTAENATSCLKQIELKYKLQKVLHIAIALFTLGTEYRLLASQKYQSSQKLKKQSVQYKKSEIYYLFAITTISTYIPFETAFLKHILKTYNNYFMIDFTKIQNLQTEISDSQNDYNDKQFNGSLSKDVKNKMKNNENEQNHQHIIVEKNSFFKPQIIYESKPYCLNKNIGSPSPQTGKRITRKKSSRSKLKQETLKNHASSDKLLSTNSRFKRNSEEKGQKKIKDHPDKVKRQYMMGQNDVKSKEKSRNKIKSKKQTNPNSPRAYYIPSISSNKNSSIRAFKQKEGVRTLKQPGNHSSVDKKLLKSPRISSNAR